MRHAIPEEPDLVDMDEHDGDLLAGMVDGSESIVSGASGVLGSGDPPKIRVIVRTRPMNAKEIEKGEENIVAVASELGEVYVDEPKQKVDLKKFTERHKFVFDDALDHSVDNDTVYRYTVQPLVQTIFKMGKATCFAYGQTGSGKTYTMSPLPPRAAAEILQILHTKCPDIGLFVACFEIYGNRIFDLLNARKVLVSREDSRKRIHIVGLREWHVEEESLVQQLIDHAAAARQTGQTGANAESSRSHAIMQFTLKKHQGDGTPGGREVGRLSFIDLAGSERGADTYDNDKRVRIEGAEINKSLLALKECIRALDGDARHVPFRGSKLTEVLRDSFIGEQARTIMIANVSPSSLSVEHTLNTLRYADRVKELRKEKAQRSVGGVTPGVNNSSYNIAAIRGAQEQARSAPAAPAPSRSAASSNSASTGPAPSRQPFIPRALNSGRPGGGGGAGGGAAVWEAPTQLRSSPHSDAENERLGGEAEAEEYLEQEDELIQSHRKEIEVSMKAVRQEMALLGRVDQPDAPIDEYIVNLRTVLREKHRAIEVLMDKINSFEQVLLSHKRGVAHH